MKNYTREDYRAAGMGLIQAHHAAQTTARFVELERLGLVRLRKEEEQESYYDVYGEPEAYEGRNGKRVSAEQARKEMDDVIDRLGCWCSVSEYRATDGGDWTLADSCGMHTGYADCLNPLENWYIPDLMSAAVSKCESALAAIEAESAERSHWEARDTITTTL